MRIAREARATESRLKRGVTTSRRFARARPLGTRRIHDKRGIRNDYFGVDLDLVWGVVERDLVTVRKRVDALLAQHG